MSFCVKAGALRRSRTVVRCTDPGTPLDCACAVMKRALKQQFGCDEVVDKIECHSRTLHVLDYVRTTRVRGNIAPAGLEFTNRTLKNLIAENDGDADLQDFLGRVRDYYKVDERLETQL